MEIVVFLNWFNKYMRNIVWRGTKNPYQIWLSEIIMQQTKVEQGTPYFEKFIAAYPTVIDLANAPEEDILSLWQGLGYYSRAINLHKTAKIIKNEYEGFFPKTYTELLNLPGVGPYTAAAIASIAFNLPVACVDGNVKRVVSRLIGLQISVDTIQGTKQIQQFVNEHISLKEPGNFNQAMMELGSLVCKKVNPMCNSCPLNTSCVAFKTKTTLLYPIKTPKKKPTIMHLNYVVLNYEDRLLTIQRDKLGIWKGLHEFPNFETKDELFIPPVDFAITACNCKDLIFTMDKKVRHLLSHKTIYTKFWEFNLNSLNIVEPINGKWILPNKINKMAISQLIKNYLNLHDK